MSNEQEHSAGDAERAEREVIRAILADNDAIRNPEVQALSPDDFQGVRARVVAKMFALAEDGEPIDVTTLAARLDPRDRDILGALDGSEAIGKPYNVGTYARLVREASNRRAAIAKLETVRERLARDPSFTSAEAFAELREAEAGRSERVALAERAPQIGAFYGSALELFQRRAMGDAVPISTGLPALDRELGGGLWPGLHILAGGTGAGKSQLAIAKAVRAARMGFPSYYIGLELGQPDTVARVLCAIARDRWAEKSKLTRGCRPPVWSDLYQGHVGSDVIARLDREHGPEVRTLGLRLEMAPPRGWHAGALLSCANELRRAHPEPADKPGAIPMLFVLDFLQLVGEDPTESGREIRERIGAAAYECRHVARQEGLSAVVLVVSSISRENAKMLIQERDSDELGKGDAGRFVSLAKEAGEVENAANTVIALCPGRRIRDATSGREYATAVHVAIAKSRERGPRWGPVLAFDGGGFWEWNEADDGKIDPHPTRTKAAKDEKPTQPNGTQRRDVSAIRAGDTGEIP